VRFPCSGRHRFEANSLHDNKWIHLSMWTLASLTALTRLDLEGCCEQLLDDGLHALASLTALTSLKLHRVCRV
jgi:hypothetical protein